jgi:ferredoxin
VIENPSWAKPLTRREARAQEATPAPGSRRHARGAAAAAPAPDTSTPGLTRREAREAAGAPRGVVAPREPATPRTGVTRREAREAARTATPEPGMAPEPTPGRGLTRREARTATPGTGVTRREARTATPGTGVTRREARTATPGTGVTRREARGGGAVPGSELTSSLLVVDWTSCEGRGLCVDLLPELLEPDPWGYPKRRGHVPRSAPGTLAAIPIDLNAPAKRAVHLCPRLALRLQSPAS